MNEKNKKLKLLKFKGTEHRTQNASKYAKYEQQNKIYLEFYPITAYKFITH